MFILTLLTPNCYMAKVDIKDAYYSLLILPEYQKYLKLPLSYLRLQQVTLAGFIDDLITISRSFAEYERNIKLILTLSDSLVLWSTQINQYL